MVRRRVDIEAAAFVVCGSAAAVSATFAGPRETLWSWKNDHLVNSCCTPDEIWN